MEIEKKWGVLYATSTREIKIEAQGLNTQPRSKLCSVLIASVEEVILVIRPGILKKRAKEHLPKCVLNILKEETNIKTKTVTNAAKISSIAEHSINNTSCANN